MIGGSSVTALHPTRPLVAYSAGCMIIVYDLLSDTKVNLIQHSHAVHALAFAPAGNSSQAGDFLVSLDFNSKSTVANSRKSTKVISTRRVSPLCVCGTGRRAAVSRRSRCLRAASVRRGRWGSLQVNSKSSSQLYSTKQAASSTSSRVPAQRWAEVTELLTGS